MAASNASCVPAMPAAHSPSTADRTEGDADVRKVSRSLRSTAGAAASTCAAHGGGRRRKGKAGDALRVNLENCKYEVGVQLLCVLAPLGLRCAVLATTKATLTVRALSCCRNVLPCTRCFVLCNGTPGSPVDTLPNLPRSCAARAALRQVGWKMPTSHNRCVCQEH